MEVSRRRWFWSKAFGSSACGRYQFMTATLSCDHRAVDGALGAEVLGVFKGLIENPVMMLA